MTLLIPPPVSPMASAMSIDGLSRPDCANDNDLTNNSNHCTLKPQCLARSVDFQRKLKPWFVLNDSVLGSSVLDNSQSTLLNLPDEILLAIFASFDQAFGQVALALTCKRLALIAREVKLSLSSTSKKYAGFLPSSVFDVPLFMKSLRPWMPTSLLLCNHCLTYRPYGTSDSATASGQGQGQRGGPNNNKENQWMQRASWEFGNGAWRREWNDICPMCNATCAFSDYVECDGCRVLGRLGNVDWSAPYLGNSSDFVRQRD